MTCRACGYFDTWSVVRYDPTTEKTNVRDGSSGGYLKAVHIQEPIKDAEPFIHIGTLQKPGPISVDQEGRVIIITTSLFACPKCGTVRVEAKP